MESKTEKNKTARREATSPPEDIEKIIESRISAMKSYGETNPFDFSLPYESHDKYINLYMAFQYFESISLKGDYARAYIKNCLSDFFSKVHENKQEKTPYGRYLAQSFKLAKPRGRSGDLVAGLKYIDPVSEILELRMNGLSLEDARAEALSKFNKLQEKKGKNKISESSLHRAYLSLKAVFREANPGEYPDTLFKD